MAIRVKPLSLTLEQPLDLAATLESGQAFRWRRRKDGYVGVVGRNLVRLNPILWGLELASLPASPEEVVPQIRHYLGLDDALATILRSVSVDQHVIQAIERYPGLRLLHLDPWETLVSFILSSASSVMHISRMVETLACSYGEAIDGTKPPAYAFPTAERLASVPVADLRRLGIGFRARYLAAAAQAVAKGELDLHALRQAPYQQAREALIRLPGVGEKVADCVLLYSLEKSMAFPIDRWIRRALERLYFQGKRLSYRRLSEWAVEHFGQYAGYAQLYLFHYTRQTSRTVRSGDSRRT